VVIFEITVQRVLYAQVTTKMGDSQVAEKFIEAGRPDPYARVLSPGEFNGGDGIEW